MLPDRRRSHSDRRQSQRVAAVFAVKNRVGGRVHLGQAEDIGPGGMTLRRPKDAPCPPQTTVSLSFQLPGCGEEIAVGAVVVQDSRVGEFRRTGVRFTRIDPEHQRLIAAYCHAGGEA
jgi:c-di-GMP-binding flagellar brake protein YcgR